MKIGVVGIGNVLMGDDAVGPYVIKLLEARFNFPPEVTPIEAGTPGLDLVSVLSGFDVIIIVDNIKAEGNAGSVKRYDKKDILKTGAVPTSTSHDPGLKEALLTMRMAGNEPAEIVLIGVIPAHIDLALSLSPPVKNAVQEMIDSVLVELERLGFKPAEKPIPDKPDIWWEG